MPLAATGRTLHEPGAEEAGEASASAVPARIQATISPVRAGSARRAMATVTGTAWVMVMPFILPAVVGIGPVARAPV